MGTEAATATWYRLVLDTLAEVVVVIDATGRLRWANRTAELVLGYELDAEVGRNVLDWVHPDDREETARMLTLSLERGYSWPVEVRVRHRDGTYLRMAGADVDPLSAGREEFVISLRRVQTPRSATASDAHLSPLFVVLHHVSDAVVAIGAEGQVVFRNRSANELLRIGAARVTSPLPAGIALAPVAKGPYQDPFASVRAGHKVARHEARLGFSDGSVRLVEVTGEPLTGSDGAPAGGVVALRDVTELRRQEAELRELALRDPLTGLANRTELMAHLRALATDRLLHGGHVVVMFVDLDRFKDVNDTFDHLVGDEVLQVTARRLVTTAGPDALVARFGGEEFVVVTTADSPDADAVARRIVEDLRVPIPTAAGLLSTSCSVGLTAGSGAAQPDQLLREADTAVYAAKRMGGATIAWYDSSQRERSARRVRAVQNVRSPAETLALLRYRPIVALAGMDVRAVRAEVGDAHRGALAARLVHDRRTVHGFVRHMAGLDRRLREADPDAPPLMCPIPIGVLAQRALVGELADVFDDEGLPHGRRLIDAVMTDPSVVIDVATLAAYGAEAGAKLVVDDPRVLLDALVEDLDLGLWAVRADRSLVARVDDRAECHALRAVGELAAAHDAPLMAERVDRPGQLRLLTDLGVHVAWGDALEPAVDERRLLPPRGNMGPRGEVDTI